MRESTRFLRIRRGFTTAYSRFVRCEKEQKNKYDRSLKICGIIVKTSLKTYTSTLQK